MTNYSGNLASQFWAAIKCGHDAKSVSDSDLCDMIQVAHVMSYIGKHAQPGSASLQVAEIGVFEIEQELGIVNGKCKRRRDWYAGKSKGMRFIKQAVLFLKEELNARGSTENNNTD